MELETPPPSWKIPLKLSILFRIPPLAQLILFCFSIRVRASTTKMFPWLIQGCATIKRSIGVSLYQRTSSISTPIQPLNKIWIERKNSLPDHGLSGLSCNRRAQCYDNEEGEKYDGCVSTTATGWPCQVWNQTSLSLSAPRNGHLRQTKPEKKFIWARRETFVAILITTPDPGKNCWDRKTMLVKCLN